MPPRTLRAVRARPEPAGEPCNNCPDAVQAEATLKLAEAMTRVATSIETISTPIVQMGEAVHALSDAQKKLCDFLVGHRLKLAASVPVVLVSIGAISPVTGDALKHALQAMGWLP